MHNLEGLDVRVVVATQRAARMYKHCKQVVFVSRRRGRRGSSLPGRRGRGGGGCGCNCSSGCGSLAGEWRRWGRRGGGGGGRGSDVGAGGNGVGGARGGDSARSGSGGSRGNIDEGCHVEARRESNVVVELNARHGFVIEIKAARRQAEHRGGGGEGEGITKEVSDTVEPCAMNVCFGPVRGRIAWRPFLAYRTNYAFIVIPGR